MASISNIKLLINQYADYKKLETSYVCLLATNHGGFLKNLENGKTLTFRRYENIINWFSAHWPADLEWPEDIERPNNNNSQGGLASEALPCTSGGNASPSAKFNKKKESV